MCSILPLLEQTISNGTKERVPHELSVCPIILLHGSGRNGNDPDTGSVLWRGTSSVRTNSVWSDVLLGRAMVVCND